MSACIRQNEAAWKGRKQSEGHRNRHELSPRS